MESRALHLQRNGEREEKKVNRSDFPNHFIFGTSTSAYQVEGGACEGGRGPSIWDTFSHQPGKIKDNTHGDSAVEHYHRYKEDLDIISDIGFGAYRFSISWPRILPEGGNGHINHEGIAYYNALIDGLLERGIEPYATLYHWDLPQALEDSIGGWLSPKISKYFAEYCEVCFSAFGDRVKRWITLNEPYMFSLFGYDIGIHAPGRSSDRKNSLVGDSTTEGYISSHNALLAHAAAVDIYKKKFKEKQGGLIGISIYGDWPEPFSSSLEDIAATQRHLEHQLGWYLDPVFFGDYPSSMKQRVGDRLPVFTKAEKELLRGSCDFLGINYYTSRYVMDKHSVRKDFLAKSVWSKDVDITRVVEAENGTLIGEKGASSWLFIYPPGLHKLLLWVSKTYGNPQIYVTENGVDENITPGERMQDCLHDGFRINYYQAHLHSVSQAIRDGVNVKGYFAWSLLDNFEWSQGYTSRFGLVFVDYNDNFKRYLKDSAIWFRALICSNSPKE